MQFPEQLLARMRTIEAVVFDVDGVFTDGGLYLSDDAHESKRFDTKDGLGVKRLLESGVRVAIISGRPSPAVQTRMGALGVSPIRLGVAEKGPVFSEVARMLGVPESACAVVGDDLPDLPMFALAGLTIAPADAVEDVRAAAHWVTTRGGGRGAVREVSDAMLAARA